MDLISQVTLNAEFTAVLTRLLAQGFEPPIILAAVSINGTYVVAVLAQAPETTDLTLGDVSQSYLNVGDSGGNPEAVALPIHIMLVDAHGAAAHVEMTQAGTEEPTILH